MYGRWAAAGITILLIIMSTTLLVKVPASPGRFENQQNVLDKLVLTYYRQSPGCHAVEEKIELVDSVKEPGKKETITTLVDLVTNYQYKFETGETGSLPWRPILTCKEPEDALVVEHVKTLIHHGYGQEKNSTLKQSKQVKDSFGLQMEIHTKFLKKKNGFFVEYRSSPDGFASKTLYLEKHENWTGLLMDPVRFENISSNNNLNTHRNVDYLTACLAENRTSHRKEFSRDELLAPEKASPRSRTDHNKLQWATAKSQCYNLESILLALDRSSVDLLVLNSSGSELGILEHLPFSKFTIQALAIKVEESLEVDMSLRIRKLLLAHGYEQKRLDADFTDNFKIFVKMP